MAHAPGERHEGEAPPRHRVVGIVRLGSTDEQLVAADAEAGDSPAIGRGDEQVRIASGEVQHGAIMP